MEGSIPSTVNPGSAPLFPFNYNYYYGSLQQQSNQRLGVLLNTHVHAVSVLNVRVGTVCTGV